MLLAAELVLCPAGLACAVPSDNGADNPAAAIAATPDSADGDGCGQTSATMPADAATRSQSAAAATQTETADTTAISNAAATTAAENAAGSEAAASSRRIFVLNAPYLSWQDIRPDYMPITSSLLDNAGLGNDITRSVWRVKGSTISPNEAAATLASGCWVLEPSGVISSTVVVPTSDVDDADNANLTDDEQAQSDVTATAAIGSETVSYGANPTLSGMLGQQLHQAGWTTIALGCSDCDYLFCRPAAMALADQHGIVDIANTQPDSMLTRSGSSPYGVQTNMDAMAQQLQQALQQTSGSAMVALDSGDLARAGTYRIKYPGDLATSYWMQALSSFDATVSLALQNMGPDDVLVIYSSLNRVSSQDHQDDGYCPVVIYGAGYDGILGSATTGRDDLVTLPDLTQTLLNVAGIAYTIDGANPMLVTDTASAQQSQGQTTTYLQHETFLADAINDGQVLMNIMLAVILVTAFLFALLMLSERITLPERVLEIIIPITRGLMLVAVAFPLATYLMIPLAPYGMIAEGAVALCLVVMAVLVVAAMLVGGFSRWLYSLVFLMALTVVVLVIDQLTGGQMARVGFLSYQPVRMGRFTGIGNEGAAVMFASWLMLAGLLLNRFPSHPAFKMFRIVGFPLLSACIICIIVAPWWGSNFGVMVWGIIGAAAAWWMFLGHRLSWKVVLISMLVCLLLTVALVLADGLSGTQSHLGTTASNLISQGIAYIPVIVGNMLRLSLDTLFYSPLFSVVLVFAWIYLARLRIAKPGPYGIFWQRNTNFKAAFTALMVTAVVMLLIEDSGILLPALALPYAVASLSWLICDLHRWELRAVEHDRGVLDEQVEPPVGTFKTTLLRRRGEQ